MRDIKDMMMNDEDDELAFLEEEDELDKKLMDNDIDINANDSLIVVTYRLPVMITR